jgi:hypothetical protein
MPPIVFGPVRSRRLGWSLGINNVPHKTCSYACIYCQVGATTRARIRRAAHSDQDEAGSVPTTDAIEGLVGILAVHPMTERAARDYVTRAGGEWRRVEELIGRAAIARVDRGSTQYLRADLARLRLGDGPEPIAVGNGRG